MNYTYTKNKYVLYCNVCKLTVHFNTIANSSYICKMKKNLWLKIDIEEN